MLHKCFVKQGEKSVAISADIMRLKADDLYFKIYQTNSGFNASGGWLKKFKRRHGIRFLKLEASNCVRNLNSLIHLYRSSKNTLMALG